jgi:hypothetical protein
MAYASKQMVYLATVLTYQMYSLMPTVGVWIQIAACLLFAVLLVWREKVPLVELEEGPIHEYSAESSQYGVDTHTITLG